LPPNITVCRDPALFGPNYYYDSTWTVAIDVDNNPSTGAQGYDAEIVVSTPQEFSGCTTSSVPIAFAFGGSIFQFSPSGQISYAGNADVFYDLANNRIVAHVPSNNAALAGLSTPQGAFLLVMRAAAAPRR